MTLALCQDVQAEAFDYPESFFAERDLAPAPAAARRRANSPTRPRCCKAAKKPLIVAGGGVLYSRGRGARWRAFAEAHGIPVAETQAGKSALAVRPSAQPGRDRRHRHRAPPTRWPRDADVDPRGRHAAAGFHHRLVGAVPEPRPPHHRRSTSQPFDAGKHGALPLVGDARAGLEALSTRRSAAGKAPDAWTRAARDGEAGVDRSRRRATPRRPMPSCPPTRR